jgi:phospholipase/carboxylesterase
MPTHLSWQSRPSEGYYCSAVDVEERWPIRTFLPIGYEPNYPYPLMVFFHGQGGDEEQILRYAPRLSRRNYISISLRGPERVGVREDGKPAYGWGDGLADPSIEDYVLRAVQQTRRQFHVHSERVYLAGFYEGATLAYRLGLNNPERYAGVISLNGAMPRGGCPLLRWNEIRSLRVLIGHGIANAIMPLTLARQDHRLLYAAGLDVTLNTYTTTHRIHAHMLRDANRWVMSHISK